MHSPRRTRFWWRFVGAVLLVGAVSAGLARPAAGQTPEAAAAAPQTFLEVRLNDGSVIYGVITSETAERIVVRTIAGIVVEVPRAQIASLKPAAGSVVEGEFRAVDSNATRLLFSPTGRSLKKGQGYVGVYEIVLPFVQVGITDRLSLGFGTPLVFFGDESGRPVWVTPKYQFFASERVNAAAGVMHFSVFGEDSSVGVAYAVATVGTDDHAWTAGAGWAYAKYYENDHSRPCAFVETEFGQVCEVDRVAKTERSPVAMIGGERRLSRRVKFISENYVLDGGGIVSAGVRFLGERLSADLGVFAPLGAEEFVVLPVVNFVWTFGS